MLNLDIDPSKRKGLPVQYMKGHVMHAVCSEANINLCPVGLASTAKMQSIAGPSTLARPVLPATQHHMKLHDIRSGSREHSHVQSRKLLHEALCNSHNQR